MGVKEGKNRTSKTNVTSASLLIKIKSARSNGGTGDQEFDLEELERDTESLRDELNDLDSIENIDLITTEGAPEGAKPGGDLVEWGSLLVTLASTLAPSLSKILQSWLTRHENHKIVLEIGGDKLEVTGTSDIERSKVIDAWISSKLQKTRLNKNGS
jgi:hypothetical protein